MIEITTQKRIALDGETCGTAFGKEQFCRDCTASIQPHGRRTCKKKNNKKIKKIKNNNNSNVTVFTLKGDSLSVKIYIIIKK